MRAKNAFGDDLDARLAETFVSSRVRKPIRLADALAQRRRHAPRRRARGEAPRLEQDDFPSPRQGASSSASGTSVVLPAPGGATSTRLGCSAERGVELWQDVVDRQAIGKDADQAGLRK